MISMDGELDISNGSVIRASRRGRPTFFNADIDGNVTLPPEITGESTDQVASITGDLSFGRFYEDGVAGDIDLVASVQGVGSEELNGQFAAENQ
ncbi:hypothetical protein [Yoonia sediminilitoris]|uniref:Uncharacterized protein n=1 Tax=Yoonia sediminilitoris TaxID=1286148 RepID=A0A2T6KK63_9RHOB|nr:hypothetical protein [Yoonia sediminilitoris]PUB16346.1 hypothetical protein C8N45_103201 [Yoonia sediminilitoris]RCW96695.1 hypothetical protein DFP92_103201 [Yoonia sediminilitoris]